MSRVFAWLKNLFSGSDPSEEEFQRIASEQETMYEHGNKMDNPATPGPYAGM